MAWGLKKRISSNHSYKGRRHCGDAEYSYVPHFKNFEFVNKPDAGATGYYVAIYLKTFVNCGLPASRIKTSMSRNRIFNKILPGCVVCTGDE
jgi:hypothetical protein